MCFGSELVLYDIARINYKYSIQTHSKIETEDTKNVQVITYSCYLARVFSKLGFATRQNMRTYCAEIEKLSIFLMIICIKYMYKSYLCLLYFIV